MPLAPPHPQVARAFEFIASNAYAPSYLKAMQRAWGDFTSFCVSRLQQRPVSNPQQVAAWGAHLRLDRSLRASTVATYMAGARRAAQLQGQPWQPETVAMAASVQRAADAHDTRPTRRPPPLEQSRLRRLLTVVDTSSSDLDIWTQLLLQATLGWRSVELRELTAGDVRYVHVEGSEPYFALRVPRAKTARLDPHTRTSYILPAAAHVHPGLCLFRIFHRYLVTRCARPLQSGLFVFPKRLAGRPLHTRQQTYAEQRAAMETVIRRHPDDDIRSITLHSGRAGLATTLMGVAPVVAVRQGRWASAQSAMRYYRPERDTARQARGIMDEAARAAAAPANSIDSISRTRQQPRRGQQAFDDTWLGSPQRRRQRHQ